MYNASFYPTPPEVAEKMLAKAGKLSGRSILEPSAGKGDLADAAVGKLECYYHTRCRELVHCIEIEPELKESPSFIKTTLMDVKKACRPRSGARAIRWSVRISSRSGRTKSMTSSS